MASSIIDTKTDKNKFGLGLETISVTLTLLETAPGKFAISYQVIFSGVQSGNAAGGPFDVSGDGTKVVSNDPKVTTTVANYSDSGSVISMHITIDADIPKLGTKTIFDETLGGRYGINALKRIVNHISELLGSGPEHFKKP